MSTRPSRAVKAVTDVLTSPASKDARREQVATQVFASLLCNHSPQTALESADVLASVSVDLADQLIKALDK